MINPPVTDEEYQAGLRVLREDWGGLEIDGDRHGMLRAVKDPMTGLLVGFRARLIGEIINRAIKEESK